LKTPLDFRIGWIGRGIRNLQSEIRNLYSPQNVSTKNPNVS
jgi:hypothetical protein